MRRESLVVCAMIAFATVLRAQNPPDFSGRWTIVQDTAPGRGGAGRGGAGRGGSAADMGSGWGSNITVTQTATRLTVEYMFFTRGDMQPPLKFEYPLDGSETKNSVMMGRGIQVQTSKSQWNGPSLVITTLYPFENPQTGQTQTTEVKQALTLESPTSLVVETTRAGSLGGAPSTSRTTYRKG